METTLNNAKKNCWIRCIEVRLYSELYNKPIIYGSEKLHQLDIKVHGEKFMSALKDKGTVTITNLTYVDIVTIILSKYYEIEIWAGYKTTGMQRFFKGYVSYISDRIASRRANQVYITFASQMVAAFSNSRMNLTLNSGINLYSAFNYILLTNGVSQKLLPESLKQEFLNEVTTNYNKPANLLESLTNNTKGLTIDTDNSIDNQNLININNLADSRVIKINPNIIIMTSGNPTINKDGLSIKLLPTMCFKIGDIIKIDNSLLDVSISNAESVSSTFNSNYIDSQGLYWIYEMTYDFENRGSNFQINIKARGLNIIKNLLGIN